MSVSAQAQKHTVTNLRCHYLINPIGIDDRKPALSWTYNGNQHRQTAYQLIVASSQTAALKGIGDLWNSGKVYSAKCTGVQYGGTRLKSTQRAYWRVTVWNEANQSLTSDIAFWEMGLLNPDDWKARWISAKYNAFDTQPDLTKASWVWTKHPSRDTVSSDRTISITRRFDLKKKLPVISAVQYFSALGSYTIEINGAIIENTIQDSSRFIDVTSHVKETNLITLHANADGLKGAIGELKITYSDSSSQSVVTDSAWQTSTGQQLVIVSQFDQRPLIWAPKLPLKTHPSPLLRTSFVAARKVSSARAYICGLGYYELYLNGMKVGDHVLDPGYTKFDKRSLYVTYDITSLISEGENAVGVMLGNGFYNQHARDIWFFHKAPWRNEPRCIVQLQITYTDGSKETVVSDSSWKFHRGPINTDGIRNGERYDANEEIDGWALPSYNDSAWKHVKEVTHPATLSAQQMPPISVIRDIAVDSVAQLTPSKTIVKLRENIAGWMKITVSGPKGARVTIKQGEKTSRKGVDQSNINWFLFQGDLQTDEYVLKGKGQESWEPRFVYHGFQYAEITTSSPEVKIEKLVGRVVHTDFEQTGSFTCSDTLLNQIHQATLRSYESNYHSIPTDCPQREKNGWLADAHLSMETALCNYENTAAYLKFIQDMMDEQAPSGQLPGIVPSSGWGYDNSGGPAWESAAVLIPWYLFQYKGDTTVLRMSYPMWKKHIEYLSANADNDILNFGLGDWLAPVKTPNNLTSTAYYYQDVSLAAKAAKLLGHDEDAKSYERLAASIRSAFQEKFFDARLQRMNVQTQTAYSI